jgi:ketosteroid isomerase-like protein
VKILLAATILCASTLSVFSEDILYSRLTTNVLERTSEQLDKAGNAQDVDTLLAHLASNVVINVSFPENPEIQRMVFSRDTYARHLADGWSKTANVTIRHLNTEYKIAEDGQSATAVSTFVQTGTVKETGKTFTSTGRQTVNIRLINGIPAATRIDMTMSFR